LIGCYTVSGGVDYFCHTILGQATHREIFLGSKSAYTIDILNNYPSKE